MMFPSRCGSCEKFESENTKLKACTACRLVKYCNQDCQIAHRPMHKKACNERVAELKIVQESSLEILPASFWESNGLASDDAEGMEILQEKLIIGSSSLSRDPAGGRFMALGGGHALCYHELALPYWETFANAPSQLEKFSVSHIQLPSIVWQTITPKISNIKTLSLTDNELGAEGFKSLARFLSSNTTLEEIDFSARNSPGNDLTDLEAAKSLSSAMKSHPALKKVSAVWMEIGGNYHSGNPTPDIAKEFIDGCENCVEVSLCQVGMNDACAPAYGDLVKRNKRLRNLFIFWEGFTNEGIEEITKGVYDTTSLNDIADSNHKCTIYTSESMDDPNKDVATKMVYVNGMDCSDALKIRYKLQRALFGVGREPQVDSIHNTRFVRAEEGKELDLSYFGDIPLELVPYVLEFMLKQRMVMDHEYEFEGSYIKRSWFVYYDETKREYLSRIFQVFKGWVVPLLFGESQADVSVSQKRMKHTTNESS